MPIRPVPPAGARRTLAAAQLTSAIGDGAYYTCSALYFTQVIGMSATRLALGLAVAWGLGSLAGVPLGHLADRRGPRGTAVLLVLATAAVVASFLVVRSFASFLAAVCLYATAQSGLTAARQALLGGLVAPSERTGALAQLQSTLNAGLALGAALGGVALSSGSRTGFLVVFAVDALGFVACGLLRLPAAGGRPRPWPPRRRARARGAVRPAVRRRDTAQHGAAAAHPLLSLVIPLWIAARSPGLGWLGPLRERLTEPLPGP